MGQDGYSYDNDGNRVPPHPQMADPIIGSGQTLTNGTADSDDTVTVVAGGTYAITALTTGGFYFGVATVATAANIIWACPLRSTTVIKIPIGITSLHFATDTIDGEAYLRKLTE